MILILIQITSCIYKLRIGKEHLIFNDQTPLSNAFYNDLQIFIIREQLQVEYVAQGYLLAHWGHGVGVGNTFFNITIVCVLDLKSYNRMIPWPGLKCGTFCAHGTK